MIGSSAGTVVIGVLVMGALVVKAVDLVKYLVASFRLATVDRYRVDRLPADRRAEAARERSVAFGDAVNGLFTLLIAAGAGIGVVFVMAHTAWIRQIQLGSQLLRDLPGTSLVLLGLAVAAIAALIFDAKKALDRTDTASTPKLSAAADADRRQRIAAALGRTESAMDLTRTVDEAIHRDVERALAHFAAAEPAAGDRTDAGR